MTTVSIFYCLLTFAISLQLAILFASSDGVVATLMPYWIIACLCVVVLSLIRCWKHIAVSKELTTVLLISGLASVVACILIAGVLVTYNDYYSVSNTLPLIGNLGNMQSATKASDNPWIERSQRGSFWGGHIGAMSSTISMLLVVIVLVYEISVRRHDKKIEQSILIAEGVRHSQKIMAEEYYNCPIIVKGCKRTNLFGPEEVLESLPRSQAFFYINRFFAYSVVPRFIRDQREQGDKFVLGYSELDEIDDIAKTELFLVHSLIERYGYNNNIKTEENAYCYNAAFRIQQLGYSVATGNMPFSLLFQVSLLSIVSDWLISLPLTIKIREKHGFADSHQWPEFIYFKSHYIRHHAEWLALLCAKYLNPSIHGRKSCELREAMREIYGDLDIAECNMYKMMDGMISDITIDDISKVSKYYTNLIHFS